MDNQFVLQAHDICKSFGTVKALNGVSFNLKKGELHALVGANGAGKSTLIKVLSGFHRPDSGTLSLSDGSKAVFHSPIESIRAGISCVHQEIDVAKDLPVYQNIFLGNDREFVKGGIVNHKAMRAKARSVLRMLGLDIDEMAIVKSLSFSQMQLMMIANALAKGSHILIFDEPTSSLSQNEKAYLFEEIGKLKKRGISIIYISHHLDEVFRLADRASVLREGKSIGTVDISNVTMDALVHMMVGKEIDSAITRTAQPMSDCALRVEELVTTDGRVNGVSFQVNAGQVVGFYGIVGAGRTELAKALFTGKQICAGKVYISGQPRIVRSTRDAIKWGLTYSSEARKSEGLLLNMSVLQNISIAVLDKISRLTVINRKKESAIADRYIEKLGIVLPSKQATVGTLSGGNQQKVVIGRWFATESPIMIFDEPTIGIDIAAKMDVLRIIGESADQGKSIIIISSEMDELFKVCNEIHVMRMGKIVKTFRPNEFDPNQLMAAATGGITNG